MTNTQFIVILVFLYFGFNCQMLFSLLVLEEAEDQHSNGKEVVRQDKIFVLLFGVIITIIFAFIPGYKYLKKK